MEPDNEDVIRFLDAARAYCRFVREPPSGDDSARFRAAAQHLATLYAAALALPEADFSTHVAEPSVDRPPWAPFECHDLYWEVHDPLVQAAGTDAIVAGSLTDDILDIYEDVAAGLVHFDAGLVSDAVFLWRFTCETHWGDHAVDALRALQRAMRT